MIEITAENVPQAYPEAIWKMRTYAKTEESRNGPVVAMPGPTLLTIHNPMERVLFDPKRNANPFFHLMEFVWMMAGRNDIEWIKKFNSRFSEYADKGVGYLNGAYGYRWRNHFTWHGLDGPSVDQILEVIQLLKTDRTTRRAVLAMWDPSWDLEPHNDLPCNTHIYFRFVDGGLNMMVLNRSNDLVWGMLGANVVHMTLLHELVAHGAGLPLGRYQVFTNNLHMYKDRPDFEAAWETTAPVDYYRTDRLRTDLLLMNKEKVEDFLQDCYNFCRGEFRFKTEWMYNNALPVYDAYMARVAKANDGMAAASNIQADDWRLACQQWIQRKDSPTSAVQQKPSSE